MKKALAIVLSLVLVLSLATVAFADIGDAELQHIESAETAGVSKNGTAWYEVTTSYTVSYPDDIEIENTTDTYTLAVSDAYLPYGQNLTVDINSANSWKAMIKDTDFTGYAYNLFAGEDNVETEIALTVAAGNHSGSVTLTAEWDADDQDVAYANYYEDQLTYVIGIAAP